MALTNHLMGQNPLLFITIKREDQKQQLCRAIWRIWDSPDFLIKSDVRSVIAHLAEHCLQGQKIHPDILIIDLEICNLDAQALFETVRPISGLRHTPLLAMVDVACLDLRDHIYDAGADLVLAWENLESRMDDVAGLAVDNWLNTDPEQKYVPQSILASSERVPENGTSEFPVEAKRCISPGIVPVIGSGSATR